MGKTKSEHSNRSSKEDLTRSEAQKKNGHIGVYLTDITWRVAAPLLMFSLGGNWIDRNYGYHPVFSIAGLLIGSAATVVTVHAYIKKTFPEALNPDDKKGQK